MYTSYNIYDQLYRYFANYKYPLKNTFIFHWESDFLAVAKQTHYVIEVEVKVSKSDFKADFNKTLTYRHDKKHDVLKDNTKLFKPNKFAFACPEGLISLNEIPETYGLYYIVRDMAYSEYSIRVIRHPKFLHKDNLFKNIQFVHQMMNKYYYRNIDLRYAMNIREVDIKYNQRRLYDETYY